MPKVLVIELQIDETGNKAGNGQGSNERRIPVNGKGDLHGFNTVQNELFSQLSLACDRGVREVVIQTPSRRTLTRGQGQINRDAYLVKSGSSSRTGGG